MFDFIVVGAGSAGAVVASRLSEVEGWRVLLLEAGGDPPRVSEVPALAGSTQGTEVDWQYKTEPAEECCQSMVNRSCPWPLGKVLGGSSILNGMMYQRGNPRDYDDWAQPGWSYDEVLPYFKKSEDLRVPSIIADRVDWNYHGVRGPLKVESWLNDFNPVMRVFIRAVTEAGYNYNPDCNGKSQLGICPAFGTLEDHRRCSTAKAFLSPAKNRNSLKVSKHSLATKVLIANSTAYGVEFINSQGETVQVRASKEVIVCGGAVNTPKLLMLSGIGPKKHLSDMGIPVVKDLPVGENLQDHQFVVVFLTMNYDPPATSPARSALEFLFKNPSSLSNFVGQEFSGFLDVLEGNGYPDVQFVAKNRIAMNDTESVRAYIKANAFSQEVEDQLLDINKYGYTVIIIAGLMKPNSQGKILLKSRDPQDNPRMIPGYLSDRRDVDRLVGIYEFFERLAQTPTLKKMGTRIHDIRPSACEPLAPGSQGYRECYLRHLVVPGYHQTSTCAMGKVLNSRLGVLGVRRLRVADASVMPFVISGNTNAPTIMVGEKAADLVKRYWLG